MSSWLFLVLAIVAATVVPLVWRQVRRRPKAARYVPPKELPDAHGIAADDPYWEYAQRRKGKQQRNFPGQKIWASGLAGSTGAYGTGVPGGNIGGGSGDGGCGDGGGGDGGSGGGSCGCGGGGCGGGGCGGGG